MSHSVGHEVEVVQVAQQAEPPVRGAAEELRVQALGLVGRLLAVALGERREPLGVPVALRRRAAAVWTHVGLVAVARRRDLAERAAAR